MAKQRSKGEGKPTPVKQRAVVVHIKLLVQERNALKAVLSLEGSTMQEYFATKAAERIQDTAEHLSKPERVLQSAPSTSSTLTPGQTYQMPNGRYIHWCAVCGNLWRSSEAQPGHCGQRLCHSPRWQTGSPARENGKAH